MITQVHEEKLRLDKEAEGRVMKGGRGVAAKLIEGQKPEGEIVGGPPSDEAKDPALMGEGLETDTSATKTSRDPLNLPDAMKGVVPVPPRALVMARIIEDLGLVTYPEGITRPKHELNMNSKKGKFIYDREFLLQFMAVCTERPNAPLDILGLDAVRDLPHYPRSRGVGGRHRKSAVMPPPTSLSAPTSDVQPDTPGRFAAANLSTLASKGGTATLQPLTSYTVIGPGGKRTRTKRGARSELTKAHVVNIEPFAPLVASANRWRREPPIDEEQNIERKVRALLNKLTMANFDSISDQIIEWANKSEAENDGRTVIHITRLVFESAVKAVRPEVYALLCRKVMEVISPNVRDDGIRDADGNPITGGRLFRKYLSNGSQLELEGGWAAKGATMKVSEDTAVKKVAELSGGVELCADGYDVTQKARRQALCLVQFITEMYKLQILTERAMHECIQNFLANVDNPEEEEIESLCRILTTVGKLLDIPKARAHMDIYFARMEKLRENSNVAPRMQFRLQDVIELREREWVPRNQVVAPTHADGWTIAGGSAPRPPPKAGDLSNFGKINKSGHAIISSVWANRKGVAEHDDTLAGLNSSPNTFMILGRNAEIIAETGSKPSRPSIGVGPGAGDTHEPQRRKLKLLPPMSEAEVTKKITEDIERFFAVRDIDESENYFTKLPPEHHHRLVEGIVSMVIASKEADGKLVADVFARAVEKGLCSISAFEEGFSPVAELLGFIAVDTPKAIQIMATMMKGAGLDKDEKRRARIARKSTDGDKLLELLA